jgi:hypothetical protein
MASIRSYWQLTPWMQFLWLPQGVNSLYSRFQACNFQNELEISVLVQGHSLGNSCLLAPWRQDAPAKIILLSVRNIIVWLHFRVSEEFIEMYFDLLKQSLGVDFAFLSLHVERVDYSNRWRQLNRLFGI